MKELPCWALVLLTVIAMLCAALVIAVLWNRGRSVSFSKTATRSRRSPSQAQAGQGQGGGEGGGRRAEDVSPNDVQDWLERQPQAVLLFYAPWCTHCHAMLPRYAEAAPHAGAGTAVGQVNCDNSPKLASLYGLRGFPTVLRFVHGEVDEEYKGDRSAQSLAQFMR